MLIDLTAFYITTTTMDFTYRKTFMSIIETNGLSINTESSFCTF